MAWIEPESEAQAQELRDKGLPSARFNVCWKCGSGGHDHTTLFRVGATPDGVAIYGCFQHRGLIGQL